MVIGQEASEATLLVLERMMFLWTQMHSFFVVLLLNITDRKKHWMDAGAVVYKPRYVTNSSQEIYGHSWKIFGFLTWKVPIVPSALVADLIAGWLGSSRGLTWGRTLWNSPIHTGVPLAPSVRHLGQHSSLVLTEPSSDCPSQAPPPVPTCLSPPPPWRGLKKRQERGGSQSFYS